MKLSEERIKGIIQVAEAMLERLGIKGTADWVNDDHVAINADGASPAQKDRLIAASEMFVATQGVQLTGNFF